MLEISKLLWSYLGSQPPEHYWQLQPWHLNAVLGVLGLLAAGGLHHLLGYTFRLYRLNTVHRPWLGLPSLLVLLVSVQVLLGSYVVGTQAQGLVRVSLAPQAATLPAASLGAMLLDPILRGPLGKAATITHAELIQAASEVTQQQYLDRLEEFKSAQAEMAVQAANAANPPGANPSGPQTPAQGAAPRYVQAQGAAVVNLGLRWLLDEGRALPPGAPALETRLPALTVALLAPAPEAPLTRAGWEQLAGEQFAQRVLQPVLARYVPRAMAAVAAVTFVLTLAYFVVLARFRRRVHRDRAPTHPPPAPAPARQP